MILLDFLFKILRIHASMSKPCVFLTVSSYNNTEAQDTALCRRLFLNRNEVQSFSGLLRGSEGFVLCSASPEKKAGHFSSLRSLLDILILEPKLLSSV